MPFPIRHDALFGLILMGCGKSVLPGLQDIGQEPAGEPIAQATDAFGRTWALQARATATREAAFDTADNDAAPPSGLALYTFDGRRYAPTGEPPTELRQAMAAHDALVTALDGEGVAERSPDAGARLIGADDRRSLSTSSAPWNAIRKVVSWAADGGALGRGECTGVYVTANHLLTARHCLMNSRDDTLLVDRPGAPDVVVCDAITSLNAPLGTGNVGDTCVAATHYFVADTTNETPNDWALLFTPSPAGAGTTFTLPGSDDDAEVGDIINAAGFPGSGETYPAGTAYPSAVRHFGCAIRDVLANRLAYDCDTVGGQSGEPVWRLHPAEQRRVVLAVHSRGAAFWNTGARISSHRATISEALTTAVQAVALGCTDGLDCWTTP